MNSCEFLKKKMEQIDMSQNELGDLVGKHQTLIARITKDVVANEVTAMKISKALKLNKKERKLYLEALEEDRLQESVRKLNNKFKEALKGRKVKIVETV